MNTEKTPLVHKLILGVLSLILVCLLVLIAQNRSKTVDSAPEVNDTTEPAAPARSPQTVETPVQTPPKETPRPARPTPSQSTTQPSRSVTAQSAPIPAPAQVQPAPAPGPYTTLVNPVGRQPVDIVLHPQTPVLKNEICGRVRLEGTPPPEIPITMDSQCSRLQEGPATTRHYLVGPEGGLANVLVYIKEGVNYSPAPPAANPVLNVTGCFFEPYVMAIQTKQKLTLQNSDRLLHNFHAMARVNREFNVSLPVRGSKTQRSFDHPEVFVRFKCDVHPWEFAYVGVVQHPFFAVTDTNGVFCLPAGLPHGRYVLAAVHLKAGETLREIVVQDEPAAPLELALDVPRRQ